MPRPDRAATWGPVWGPVWAPRLVPAIVAVVSVLGSVFRQTGVPTWRTIWAEDGGVFGQCGFTGPSFLACLATPYDGWIHAAPRLLAFVATVLPPAGLSYWLTAGAALATAACGYAVARSVRSMTGSGAMGGLAGVSLTLVQMALFDLAGNVTNLHWILIAAAATVLVATWLGHRLDPLDIGIVLLAAASSPFSLLLVGLAGVAAVLGAGSRLGASRLRALALVLGAIAIVQLVVGLTAERVALPPATEGGLSPISWYLRYVVNGSAFGGSSPIPSWLVSAALAVSLGVIVVRAGLAVRAGLELRPRPAGLWSSLVTAEPVVRVAAVVALVGTGLAVLVASAVLNHHVAQRHVYDIAALTVIAMAVGIGLATRPEAGSREAGRPDASRRSRWGAGIRGATLVIVLLGFAGSFRGENAASTGPDFVAEYDARSDGCSGDAASIVIPVSPTAGDAEAVQWQVEIPCDRIEP